MSYFANLTAGRIALWCFLIWYLATVIHHFDATPAIWINAVGISGIIGIALYLSVREPGKPPPDRWTVFRLFLMPFCVSSFSSLIKGKGFVLVFPPDIHEIAVSLTTCVLFVATVVAIKKSTRTKSSALVLLILCACVAHTGDARAGLFQDSMTYEISVVDEQSRSIEGATVWELGDTVSGHELGPEVLARLVRRYTADVDFVFGDNLHPQLWVLRTGSDGSVVDKLEDTEVGGLERVRTAFAAFKRGYLPAQIADDSRNNSRRRVVLRLKPDPAAIVDPRMVELDRIRALATSDADDVMGAARQRQLREFDLRLRRLAADLERDEKFDEAAAVYYNLAYLPSVDTFNDETGALIVRGYTNGFDDRDPRRVADRKRAWQLARNHPILEYEAMLDSYRARGLLVMAYDKDAPLRRAYIADTEQLIGKHGERLWPSAHELLERAYVADGEFAAGCRALRARHDFEPSMRDVRGWIGLIESYQSGVKLEGGPLNAPCDIAGVPAPPLRR